MAFTTWRGVFSDQPLSDTDAQALRDELDAVSRRLELPCRQARLLAEAALTPLKELLENSGISHKPKRRSKAVEADDDASLLDEDPVDPSIPSAAELAELSAPAEAPAPAEVEVPAALPEDDKPRRGRKKGAEA